MAKSADRFVAVDPGTTTGVVFVDLTSIEGGGSATERLSAGLEAGVVVGKEYDTSRWWETELALDVWDHVWSDGPIVIEDWILRTADKKRTTIDPVRVTSALVAVMFSWGWKGKVVYQQPSDAKGVVTNERLREWKLWTKGSPHVRDAMRHAIIYLRRNT